MSLQLYSINNIIQLILNLLIVLTKNKHDTILVRALTQTEHYGINLCNLFLDNGNFNLSNGNRTTFSFLSNNHQWEAFMRFQIFWAINL